MLVAISNDLRRQAAQQHVATSFAVHREFAARQLRRYKAYEHMERGVLPPDALMAGGALGIQYYYLPDLKIIDRFGLTDATVARNPVTRANHEREIGHDRRPPPGYLEERGVNIAVRPAARSQLQAFMRAQYAVRFGPELWMSFDAPDEEWVLDRFAGRSLRVRDMYYAGLSWEKAVPDFDYRSGELGFVVNRSFPLSPLRPRVQAFAGNCAPDELLVWPWSNEETDIPALQRWTVSGTGLCRATAITPPEWARSVVDDPSRLEEVERTRVPAIRSVFDVHLLGKRLLYFRQPCRPGDNDATFFLHVVPVDGRDLPDGRRRYGFDNLDFRMKEYTGGGERCAAVRRLPDYPIAELRTGQFTDEGRIWEGAIVVAGSGGGGRPPP